MKKLTDSPAKHTRPHMPKPVLDAAMGDVLCVTPNVSPPKGWRYIRKHQAAIAKRKREAQG